MQAPKLVVGNQWIMEQTKGDELGVHTYRVADKRNCGDVECYMILESYEKWPADKYKLTYLSTEGLLLCKEERYEHGILKDYMDVLPPSNIYGFPMRAGKKWRWKGVTSALGTAEGEGEILGEEETHVPAGVFACYHLRTGLRILVEPTNRPPLTVATASELWYSPDKKHEVKSRTVVTILEDSHISEEVLIG